MARKTNDETPETTLQAEQSELEALRAQNAAKDAQNEQMLDMLVEMKEQIEQLQAGQLQTTAAPGEKKVSKEEAKLDDELKALMEEFKDYPSIHVFEQRVVLGSDASADIRLTGDPTPLEDPHGTTCRWKLRWFNFGKEGRAQQAGQEGYEKVAWDDLQDRQMVVTGDQTKPHVTRGERGQEVLHKIPRKLFEYKKRRDAARLNGLLQSESRLRDHIANGVANLAGKEQGGNADQAGTTVRGAFLPPTITPEGKTSVDAYLSSRD